MLCACDCTIASWMPQTMIAMNEATQSQPSFAPWRARTIACREISTRCTKVRTRTRLPRANEVVKNVAVSPKNIPWMRGPLKPQPGTSASAEETRVAAKSRRSARWTSRPRERIACRWVTSETQAPPTHWTATTSARVRSLISAPKKESTTSSELKMKPKRLSVTPKWSARVVPIRCTA